MAKKTMVVHRTSLTTPLYNASVALHHAINGMKPRLMKKKMMVELLKGVGEVNLLKEQKHALQMEDRILCEEIVAIEDRLHWQTLEVNRNKARLVRCLDNLNQKKELFHQATQALEDADDPADCLAAVIEVTEQMTARQIQDFVRFIDDQTTEGIHESTKYAFDVLSLLLNDTMPMVKEVPITLHLSYEELHKYESNADEEDEHDEEENLANDGHGTEEEQESEPEEKEEEDNNGNGNNHQLTTSKQPLDAVAKATALHRKSIGLSAVTERTSQQTAFLKALEPKHNSGNEESNPDDEDNDDDDDDESHSVHANPEEAVKAYPRSTRQAVIEHVGRDDWVTMSWDERLENMIEFAIEQAKELPEEPFEVWEDYDDVYEQHIRYFESTINAGTARYSTDVSPHRKQKKRRSTRAGLLSDACHPLFIDRLKQITSTAKTDDGKSLLRLMNAEKEELMEGYLDIANMCRFTLWLGRSGQLGALVWDWNYAAMDYIAAKPIYDALKNDVNKTMAAVAKAQDIYDIAADRDADSSLKLKTLKALLPQTAWCRRRQQKYIQDQNNAMAARTKWPIYLRQLDAPAKFTVMVQQLASMQGKLARLIRHLQKATADVHQRTRVYHQAANDLTAVQEECASILCPWNWYMPDGRKWASIIHNKWFKEHARVTVLNDNGQGLQEISGTISGGVFIHPNGRKRYCTVQYDGGGSDEVDHLHIKMQYPQLISMDRAMEDFQEKFVSTRFDTACQTKMLLNMSNVIPKLKMHLSHASMTYEDARTCLYRSDLVQRLAGARLIQCIWRKTNKCTNMKKVRSWKSGEKMRAFLSANLIKFHKMKQRNLVFSTRLLQRVRAVIVMQRTVRGHLTRLVYWEMLDEIAEEERMRIEKLEQRRQEQEFANRLRASHVEAARTKNWRCPRCPLSVAYKTKFSSPQDIAAHIEYHDDIDRKKLMALEQKEAIDMELKRMERIARASKEDLAMAKMKALMAERDKKLKSEAVARAKKQREKKLEQMNALFTIKYQRPVLPSLRRKGSGFTSYATKDLSTSLAPPYPELRLVRNSMRKVPKGEKGRKRGSVLPEKIMITCSPFRFGRSSSCNAPLDCFEHPGLVSKDHALMFVRGSPMVGYTLVLADLHSTNGTFINQKRVQASTGTEYDRHNRTVKDGDILVFGCRKNGPGPGPENGGGSGVVLSTVCYQLWMNGSGFTSY